ncbi:MAG TPA: TRAP transporter small permease subunit [Ilumatobacteraceae bacterium]|nr:TRAP transporter small permease subunit [Ilumatobacteraceae bacterium]
MGDDRTDREAAPEPDEIVEVDVADDAIRGDATPSKVRLNDDAPAFARALDVVRRAIERIADGGGWLARYLVIAIFVVGILNVILRYWGRATDSTLVSNLWIDAQWQMFALLFLVGFPYGIKEKVNPRVDFWYSNYSPRRKALLDLVLHVCLLLPFCVMGVRVVWPFAMSALGRSFDGTWDTWKVWTTWEESSNPDGLPVGPIKAMLVVGFVLWGLQVIAEIIKAGFVLARLVDEDVVEEPDAPARIE